MPLRIISLEVTGVFISTKKVLKSMQQKKTFVIDLIYNFEIVLWFSMLKTYF